MTINNNCMVIYSGPIRQKSGTRRIKNCLYDMVKNASNEIIVSSYDLTDINFIHKLKDAADRGVKIVVVAGRFSASQGKSRKAHKTLKDYSDKDFKVYRYKRNPGTYTIMHTKIIVVDRTKRTGKAYLGSANFTEAGLNSNIEAGIVVQGSVVNDVYNIVENIRKSKYVKPIT